MSRLLKHSLAVNISPDGHTIDQLSSVRLLGVIRRPPSSVPGFRGGWSGWSARMLGDLGIWTRVEAADCEPPPRGCLLFVVEVCEIHMLHLSCRELSCRGPDSEERRSLAGPGDRVQSGPPATAGFTHSLLPKEAPVAQGANALTMASVTVRPLLDTGRTLEPPLDHSVKGRGDNERGPDPSIVGALGPSEMSRLYSWGGSATQRRGVSPTWSSSSLCCFKDKCSSSCSACWALVRGAGSEAEGDLH
ncbi:unnamed protein product [Gadus morhua 'NCC']